MCRIGGEFDHSIRWAKRQIAVTRGDLTRSLWRRKEGYCYDKINQRSPISGDDAERIPEQDWSNLLSSLECQGQRI